MFQDVFFLLMMHTLSIIVYIFMHMVQIQKLMLEIVSFQVNLVLIQKECILQTQQPAQLQIFM